MNLSDLSIKDLEAIVTVADAGHFGRAAETLVIAQPTLSAQVKKVETILGVEIFERTGRRFLVTPIGQRMLQMSRDLLIRARTMANEAAAAADFDHTPLSVGIIPTLGPYLIPHLLSRKGKRPAIPPLAISEHTTGVLMQQLRDGAIDAAIVSIPVQHESVRERPIFDEPFRLVVPKGHPLATTPRLAPSSLIAREMVLLEEGHCLRDQAMAVCRAKGPAKPRVVAASLETLKYLVAAGEGYSLLPLLSCRLTPELKNLVEVRAFDDRTPYRRVGICSRISFARSKALDALAELVRIRVLEAFGRDGVRDASRAVSTRNRDIIAA